MNSLKLKMLPAVMPK